MSSADRYRDGSYLKIELLEKIEISEERYVTVNLFNQIDLDLLFLPPIQF